MMNSVEAAQMAHDFIYNGWRVQTHGNPLAHCILRGAVNQHGRNIPNYHYEDLHQLADLYATRGLANPAIVVDTNHANSNKLFHEQIRIAHEVLRSRSYQSNLNTMVKGLMIESFIEEGNQKPEGTVYGKSITDPCLGWASSETLVKTIAEMV